MAWLDMPIDVIASYARQIPRLQAREHLASIVTGRVAAGQTKPAQARKTVRQLERDAEIDMRRPANPKALEAAGIKVERR